MPTSDQTKAAQDAAVARARELVSDPRLLAVDTETTGLDGPVWECAVLDASHCAVLSWVASTGDAEWSDVAREMHAERLTQIASAPNAEVFREATAAALQGRLPVAYNAQFDKAALERTFPGTELPGFIDLAELYAPFGGRWSESRQTWKFISLKDACAYEGIDLRDHHTAQADAAAALELLRALAGK